MNPQIIFFIKMAHKYIQEGHLESAERTLRQIQKMQAKNFEVSRLLGVIAAHRGEYEEAIQRFDESIRLDSKNPITYSNKANALKALNYLDLALESYDKSIALDGNYAEAHNNKGNGLFLLERYQEAVDSYDRAIALNPNYADAFNGRGNSLSALDNFSEALESFEIARSISFKAPHILASSMNIRMKMCHWDDLQEITNQLCSVAICPGSKTHPFDFLALLDDPYQISALTKQYMLDMFPERKDLGVIEGRAPNKKIKIAYFSGDFLNHPVAYLMAGVLEEHDRSKFEIYGFSYRDSPKDEMQIRVKNACDIFLDVNKKTDKEVALLARDLQIDIAVDLGGLTAHNRPRIFSYRAAPIQIGYIGFLGSMAAPYYDYLVADETIIPAEFQSAYSEKLIYLPTYQANDPKRKISDKVFTREQVGLPDKGFVYCCFNNNFKITPSILGSWSRILNKVEGSVLWVYANNETIKQNLRNEIESRGISGDRIIFGGRLPQDEYLSRYRVADLFLDTSPYNAGTTASDALWAGLPVLTFMGQTFSGRMGASILRGIGLPELIATTQNEYEDMAIYLGQNPDELKNIKNKLAENRLTAPLFDAKNFTLHLETSYRKIYDRQQAGLPPEHIACQS
ncbi:tetratricopeptide repeat protein [Polynucleobacter sp. 80A-SIGWE]|uniref:O-linked N-acetylglucosamine transferase, SPINDLY family protein n=1 Tax=Polynucleobacter sp. 80A-SIGWE TaxID=2689100 RepID=UPI001C0B54AA|nr:tetratricopeptide repeat protein [Polynucleobacter sp. 80A-SIGWE]MBU3588898.1 tetratricopeptide repeat protein [Polynucleobacter sp. 80A-SIGWE]